MAQKLKQVRPEDFNAEALMAAAQEGRLYVEEATPVVNREQVIESVRLYVGSIACFVTPKYSSKIKEIWDKILSIEDVVNALMPTSKAKLCKDFNKYYAVQIIGILREHGIYKHYSQRIFDKQLENTDRESPFRRYLGMGIEPHSLLMKILKIVQSYKI